jgi:hypothetical protein
VCPDIGFREWAIHSCGSNSIPTHAVKLFGASDTTRILLPARCSPSTLRQNTDRLPESTISRQLDWERRSPRMASYTTRFDTYWFIFLELHKEHCVPNTVEGWGWRVSPINRCMWIHQTGDAANTWEDVGHRFDTGRTTKGHMVRFAEGQRKLMSFYLCEWKHVYSLCYSPKYLVFLLADILRRTRHLEERKCHYVNKAKLLQ